MTKKMFLDNSYGKEFIAQVKDVIKLKENYGIILDKTYFYPESGGQPSDLGTIDGIEVIDVYYYKDSIIHLVKEKIEEKEVLCKLDYYRRFNFMQQHLGQHILSRCLELECDANTVGFHMGDGYVTIDVDKKIDSEKIYEVETNANQIIYDNLEVYTLYPTKEELKKMTLRKEPSVTENIRVIEIDGFDYSPCGGTHLKTTSEVGMIKIIRIKKHKSGIRITFLCGRWALSDYRWKNQDICEISDLFAISESEVKDRVVLLNTEVVKSKKTINLLKTEKLEYEINNLRDKFILHNGKKIISKIIDNKSINELRYIANVVTSEKDYIVCLISSENNKVNLVISKSKNVKTEINQLFFKYITLLNGHGGGSDFLLQGSGNKGEEINNILTNFLKIEF